MAATFHFTFFYFYRSRPINYAERIIDSCLSLQETHGLFSGNAVGQTCLDYDAIDLLAKASLLTRYRSVDVRDAMNKASDALLTLSNDDGGFVNCKQKIRHFNDRKHRLLRKVGLRRLVPASTRVRAEGDYTVCWKLLSCTASESNAFSTWFRMVSLYLTQIGARSSTMKPVPNFRSLPFLGYHTETTFL